MNCGTCKHFRPTKNPETGKALPSQLGKCAYPVRWPDLPQAYVLSNKTLMWPSPLPVSRGSGSECKMWELKLKTKAPVQQQKDLFSDSKKGKGNAN
ncbi:hypothetical protein [Giesbergeria anulus]|uniref:Uncharacterized protein n=1 Tax=Giesbergeria anulus TaxID=180197 RepID=A0A1H9NR97_9BURK|nr:hypothetical protein [Giesbergeria anulus]SER38500.1 hypothetical protein SAMN02982919_02314 [Giesbergeria anulus]